MTLPIDLSNFSHPMPSHEELLEIGAAKAKEYRRHHRTAHQLETALAVWKTVLPARIANEDLGDYIEDIDRLIARKQNRLAYLRLLAAIFWTGVNAIGYLRKKLRKRSGA